MNAAAPCTLRITADELAEMLNELSVLRTLVRRCPCGEPTRHDAPLCEECLEERYRQAPNWPSLPGDVPF